MQNAFIFRIFISYCVINCAPSNSITGWSSCPLAASPKTPQYLFYLFFFFFLPKIMHLFTRAYIFAMSNANLHNKFVPFIVSIYIRVQFLKKKKLYIHMKFGKRGFSNVALLNKKSICISILLSFEI